MARPKIRPLKMNKQLKFGWVIVLPEIIFFFFSKESLDGNFNYDLNYYYLLYKKVSNFIFCLRPNLFNLSRPWLGQTSRSCLYVALTLQSRVHLLIDSTVAKRRGGITSLQQRWENAKKLYGNCVLHYYAQSRVSASYPKPKNVEIEANPNLSRKTL